MGSDVQTTAPAPLGGNHQAYLVGSEVTLRRVWGTSGSLLRLLELHAGHVYSTHSGIFAEEPWNAIRASPSVTGILRPGQFHDLSDGLKLVLAVCRCIRNFTLVRMARALG